MPSLEWATLCWVKKLEPVQDGGSLRGPMCLQFDVYRMYEVSANTEA